MDELSLRAVNLDPTDRRAWSVRFLALADAGRWPAAEEAVNKAIKLDPYSSHGYELKGWMMSMLGRPAEAFPILDQAIALDPENAGWPLRAACEAHMLLGQNDQAIAACEKAAGIESTWFITSFLAAAYANRGDMAKAVAARKEVERLVPGYTIAQLRAKHYSDEPEYVKMAEATWYAGLRKAGLPEK
jgi:tetratricopeptide (TPR) repeat protein